MGKIHSYHPPKPHSNSTFLPKFIARFQIVFQILSVVRAARDYFNRGPQRRDLFVRTRAKKILEQL